MMFNRITSIIILAIGLSSFKAEANIDSLSYVSSGAGNGNFPLSVSGSPVSICYSKDDFPGAIRAIEDLREDIAKVTGSKPELLTDKPAGERNILLIGTLGRNHLIDQLVKTKKIDASAIKNQWESFIIQSVDNPFKGVDKALVIIGSDKRGTIYGAYDLSESIGVSPWYWWADVPVKKQADLYITPGRHTKGSPKVKYRGIFINDEAPALSGWAFEKFGGFNHQFYEKVYELILRMKGNYLWPAMWGRSLFDDDSLSAPLADEYGVVLGTSHHEPLMRSHVEWSRYGSGAWNYATNEATLRKFWRKGIERMGNNESIVTIGMRGDGDEPMTEGTAISLLERIVKDQREIIADVTGKAPEETPQMWALYKEVQDYYDKGMRVPEDVTLLLCDDNWGNIRKLPQLNAGTREGGYGIYYHFDYVGGPRNYKWLNTNQIERTWEQMHLAFQYGADKVWIVNVGDIKPMEFPIEFFLDYAWDPGKWPASRLPEYSKLWAEQQFGPEYANEIADILNKYTKYNSRRKPELLSPDTYSLTNYQEAERVVSNYNELVQKAEEINSKLPEEYKDAYYQLVLFPVKACANLNEMYVKAAKNKMYARQGRAATNDLAEKVEKLFDKDAELTDYYHHKMANGKWNHMMSQTHIGYTYWQQPDKNNMPEVAKIEVKEKSDMGIAIQGTDKWWPEDEGELILPTFNPFSNQTYYIEIFNRGKEAFEYEVSSKSPWIKIGESKGKVDKEKRIWVSIDWQNVPKGNEKVPLEIAGPGNQRAVVYAVVNNSVSMESIPDESFVETNGFVSINAENFTKAVNSDEQKWSIVPNLGRTASAVTVLPAAFESIEGPGNDSPHLEYKLFLVDSGKVDVQVFLSPTLNFHNNQGLRYAISFDDEKPQVVNVNGGETNGDWNSHVADNINITTSDHALKNRGKHILKLWLMDPGMVVQKIVVDCGGLKPSYLGPPESYFKVD